MDEENKKKFRIKYYYLVVELNIIILLVALGIMAAFIGPRQFRIPLIIIFTASAIVLSLHFRKKYAETKALLDEHADTGNGT